MSDEQLAAFPKPELDPNQSDKLPVASDRIVAPTTTSVATFILS